MKKILPALLCVALVAAMITPAFAGGGKSTRRGNAHARSTAGKRLPALTDTHHDALYRKLQGKSLSPARYAFHRARSVFHLKAVKTRFGRVRPVAARDVTMVLRDLVIRQHLLPARMQRNAKQVLARPGAPTGSAFGARVAGLTESHCGANVCYHWTKTGGDAPSLTDTSPANGRPDWIDSNEATFENVFSMETGQYGYRAPKSDSASPPNLNPNGKIDVYISDLGAQRIYGYCTSDDPAGGRAVSSYCGMDDDFAANQFPTTTGLQALQVTAAHEFFHAVQFAYDIGEDSWWMEATATWMEDELYDSINDNHQYLGTGPMGAPALPLDSFIGFDTSDQNAGYQYGAWIFPRFLEELGRHSAGADDQAIIRQIWEKLDGSGARPTCTRPRDRVRVNRKGTQSSRRVP